MIWKDHSTMRLSDFTGCNKTTLFWVLYPLSGSPAFNANQREDYFSLGDDILRLVDCIGELEIQSLPLYF